jgi:hypothetical protein
MLPDHIIQIPFEVLRMIKRESQLIVPTGMPVCKKDGEIKVTEPKSMTDLQEMFYTELVTIISRHFIDDRIANPDLKEIYLVRLNILL